MHAQKPDKPEFPMKLFELAGRHVTICSSWHHCDARGKPVFIDVGGEWCVQLQV
jgi:hypothetical protein